MNAVSPLYARSSSSRPLPMHLFRGEWEGAKKKKKAKKQKPPYEAPNSLQSKATARVVELISQGEIGGLVNGSKSIFFDDVPLQNADGTFNYEGVNWEERTGTPDQTYLAGFPSVETEATVGLQARRNRQEVGSGKLANAGGSRITFAEVYLDKPDKLTITPVTDNQPGDTYVVTNFDRLGFDIAFKDKTGTNVARHFDYLAEGISNPVTQTIANSNIDAIRVTVRLPAIMNQTTNGDLLATQVQYAFDIKGATGDYVEALLYTIDGKNNSAYETSHRLELPKGQAPWTIRMRRLTPDSDTSSLLNDTYWAGYTQIIDAKLTYADRAVIGLTLDATYFGDDIPTRSYEVYGRLLQVPSNYDPETREYDGIWDGTFTIAWSDNPVWVFYDLLTHKRYGLGHRIDPSNIDKWALYSIAKYCDELVDNGKGGLEPRYTFNGAISDQEDAYTVLNSISSSFMSMIYWGTDTVTCVQDSPKEVSRIVTPANVIDGQFNYSGSGLRARSTVVYVTWNDPTLYYKQRITVVEDPEMIQKWGYRQRDVTLVGCTSPGLAYRMGKAILQAERYQTDTITYQAGLDHADTRPGDIVSVQDPAIAGMRLGGRIKSISGTAVELDAPIDVPLGSNTLYVVVDDGTVQARAITTGAGPNITNLTIATPLTKATVPGAMWTISTAELAPRQFRVLAAAESELHQFEITGLLHDPYKYDRIEKEGIILPQATSTSNLGALHAPMNVNMWEYQYAEGSGRTFGVQFAWSAPKDTRVVQYEAEVMMPGETSYFRWARTQNLAVDMRPSRLGIARFRVRSMSREGVYSTWAEREFTLKGLYGAPSNPTGFVGFVVDNMIHLSWDLPPDYDYDYSQLRFIPDGGTVDWDLAQEVIVKTTATSGTVPYRRGTYLLKHRDTVEQWSEEAAELVVGLDLLSQVNVVQNFNEDPNWVGTHNGTRREGVYLTLGGGYTMDEWFVLANVAPLNKGPLNTTGEYTSDTIVDLTEVYTNRVSIVVDSFGDLIGDKIADWLSLSSVPFLSGADNTKYTVTPLMSTTVDDPFDIGATWTAWMPVALSDYVFRGAKFKLILTSSDGTVRPMVRTFKITVDMQDRVEGQQNVFCPDTGLTITYDPAFKVTPALAVECPNLLETEKKVITGETRTGFTVQFFDTVSGLPVAKYINWLAKGYGRVTTP